MEYKVPQNIDIEDRIVGPLTLRQFLILLIGAGICFLLYIALQGPLVPLFLLLTVVIGSITMGMAFIDYGGKHPETIVLDALATITRPKQLVWKRDSSDVNADVLKSQGESAVTAPQDVPTVVTKKDFNEMKEKLHRASAFESGVAPQEVVGAEDPFSKENPFLESTLSQAAETTTQAEPLLSQLASVKPNEEFKYPKIETNDRKFL